MTCRSPGVRVPIIITKHAVEQSQRRIGIGFKTLQKMLFRSYNTNYKTHDGLIIYGFGKKDDERYYQGYALILEKYGCMTGQPLEKLVISIYNKDMFIVNIQAKKYKYNHDRS